MEFSHINAIRYIVPHKPQYVDWIIYKILQYSSALKSQGTWSLERTNWLQHVVALQDLLEAHQQVQWAAHQPTPNCHLIDFQLYDDAIRFKFHCEISTHWGRLMCCPLYQWGFPTTVLQNDVCFSTNQQLFCHFTKECMSDNHFTDHFSVPRWSHIWTVSFV